MFVIDQTCEEFFNDYWKWGDLQTLLDEDVTKFEETYKDPDGSLKKFPMVDVPFENKFGVMQDGEGWFEFEFSLWWRMHSNEPRCFAGDHLTSPTPVCNFECADLQCRLKGPPPPHKDNRLLAADMSPVDSVARKRFL